ncbi:MAG: hypothetical protein J6T08_06710, partial [Lentisphaeria bacterium]|nr:hypothetical protein [Lentisphaeria bacterium]
IPILAVSFLVGGITCGLLVCDEKKAVFKHIGVGAMAMLPAVALIALASSVKLIMAESGILDTIMHFAVNALSGKSPFLCKYPQIDLIDHRVFYFIKSLFHRNFPCSYQDH